MIISTENPLYSVLYRKWLNDSGEQVQYDGKIYQVIRDNGDIRFSEVADHNPFGNYGDVRHTRGITTSKYKP